MDLLGWLTRRFTKSGPHAPVASREREGGRPAEAAPAGWSGYSPWPLAYTFQPVTVWTQTANTNNCQFVPAGSDSTTAVACQPVTPTGVDAEMMMPGSAGMTAKPPPEMRPLGQVACTFLVAVVSLGLAAAVVLELTVTLLPAPGGPVGPAGPGGPCAPAGPAAPAAPASPASPVSPFSPLAPLLPFSPAGPVLPVGPTGPMAPNAPVGPVGPAVPGVPDVPAVPGAPSLPAGPVGPGTEEG
jgi:hypothetical protein